MSHVQIVGDFAPTSAMLPYLAKKDILVSSDTQSKQRGAVSGFFENEIDDQCQLSLDCGQNELVPRRGDCTHFFLSFQ